MSSGISGFVIWASVVFVIEGTSLPCCARQGWRHSTLKIPPKSKNPLTNGARMVIKTLKRKPGALSPLTRQDQHQK
jgi:hypothetical protein